MAVNVVNACYRPEINDICFPSAILHEPVFDINAPTSLRTNVNLIQFDEIL